jgi:TolB-like protein/Tfp pilus assembly protein PilF
MPGLQVNVLGAFEARDGGGQPLTVSARKSRALIAALALAPQSAMARESLAGLLWSDRGEEQARSSLRQAIAGLRKDFGATGLPLLAENDGRLSLDLDRIEIDVVAFQREADATDVSALDRAAALYRGDLLADTYVDDPEFNRWLASERIRLTDIAIGLLERLMTHKTGAERVELAKRLVSFNPLREASHRLLMQAYAAVGEKGLALKQYELCRDALRTELHVSPGEETEALRQQLLRSSVDYEQTSGARVAVNGAALNGDVAPALAGKPAIAVLPFSVMGSGEDMDGFADGLTEDLTTGLARISAIRVIARNTMFTYKRRAVDIRSLGHELGAKYVLEGSVRRSGKHVRVSAQLIEAASGHHVWAEQIDRTGADTLALQDAITQLIVASVQTQLILNEGKTARTGGAVPADRITVLLARSWQRFLGLTAESLAEARSLAERALQLDSGNGTAHRMVAAAIYHQVYMGFVPWSEQAIAELYTHAKTSIECADADEYCHWAMTCAHILRKQHDRAVASLRRALEINPNCSIVHGSMGTVLAWAGDPEKSIERNELALRINPQDPTNFFRHFGLALAHYLAGRYAEAAPHAAAVSETRPAWWLGQLIYCASLAKLQREDEANVVLADLRRLRPGFDASALDVLPFARSRDLEHLADGLRHAGAL